MNSVAKRRKVLLLMVLAAAMVLLLLVPSFAQKVIEPVPYCRLKSIDYRTQTAASGVVYQSDSKAVYLGGVVPTAVLVREGEAVKKGQVIAVIDRAASAAAAGVTVNSSPKPSEELLAAAALYGVSNEQLSDYLPSQETTHNLEEIPTEVLSPMDGVVTALSLREGTLSGGSAPAVLVASGEHWEVRAKVSETAIGQVAVGDDAEVTLSAHPEKIYRGSVSSIAASATRERALTTQSASVEVVIRLEAPDAKLKEEYSASATILGSKIQPMVVLPYQAVQQGADNREYVEVYNRGRVERQEIVTGQELAQGVQVLAGLSESDIVLIAEGETKRRVRLGEEVS